MNIQEEIKHQISNGETEKAIKLLLDYSETHNKDFQKNCLLLSSQFQQWKNDNIRGIKKESEDLRKIEFSILELLDFPESDIINIVALNSNNTKTKRKWILPAILIFILIPAVFVIIKYYLKEQVEYTITEPRDGEIVNRQLIDNCCYWITVKGKADGDAKQRIFGKYFHEEEWFFEEIENPIEVKSDGSWEVAFPHGDEEVSAKKRESFKFGIYLIEPNKSIKDYKKLNDVSFEVVVID